MKPIAALATKDVRVVYRDRFMIWITFYALLLAVIARFAVPSMPVADLGVYLAPAVVLFGTILLGTLLGFALIEEREQGTWLLLRVLPLGAVTLFGYLAGAASLLSFLVSLAAAVLYGQPVSDWGAFWFMLTASALAAPLVMLVLGALASNKIEGLAVNKIISTTGLLPLLVFAVSPEWQLLAAWCPWYWLYLGFLHAYAVDPARLAAVQWPGYSVGTVGGIAIALSLAASAVMMRLYTRRAT